MSGFVLASFGSLGDLHRHIAVGIARAVSFHGITSARLVRGTEAPHRAAAIAQALRGVEGAKAAAACLEAKLAPWLA